MARLAPGVLRRYLLGGQLPSGGYLNRLRTVQRLPAISKRYHETQTTPEVTAHSAAIPFRKQLKDDAKSRKAEGTSKIAKVNNQTLEKWELTVGIEIHAQLNTKRKLFSSARSTIDHTPNTQVEYFDLALPGSMPLFQTETLIPALRAALALNCNIQERSKFDRKHYFHWDQPAGYQITQYYEPFAKDGNITLYAHDGIAKEDGEEIKIGIKQVQMEQDTAKTISEPGDIHLLDFNRVGLPLIEIITLPVIHHPSTAAAFVRKVQILLKSVDACVLGMQSGGLRADVNVSVRRRDAEEGRYEYAGMKGLGQRTEIKNLSSFKAVEDAIIAERDRQIQVLESGGAIEGETRGWTIGHKDTVRLRGKEGEVDYRYMPDPDIAPVIIGQDLIGHLQSTMGVLPDEEIEILTKQIGLTIKDAMSLLSIHEAGMYYFFRDVVDELMSLNGHPRESVEETSNSDGYQKDLWRLGRLAGNWVLHEMGGLNHPEANQENPLDMRSDGCCRISSVEVAKIVFYLDRNRITGASAKKVLSTLFKSSYETAPSDLEEAAKSYPPASLQSIDEIIEEAGLWFVPLSDDEYVDLANSILDMKVVEEILSGKEGKINFLLGKMMRQDKSGRVDPKKATEVLRRVIEEHRK
ncbi:hypothetical protein HYALB_00005289 [Hymenoscyphus albidus]|uniref:Glutamyl-tRNA(Gln) amidotransferase subunit B, mitochondrial n=1 Tax=Hymenoscyphus albidus TaxID=595503 RepID=A0A9N9LEH9_9HELO|nr:hypothetical protein HYALB_00005289 [Hymenoscyphus albidus]